MPFRTRGYLPHLESEGSTYFVTFRLAGTIPPSILHAWQDERDFIMNRARSLHRDLSPSEKMQLWKLQSEHVEAYLDSGMGECHLKNHKVAQAVADALNHFHGTRYFLHAWCIMPNHVHVVFTPIGEQSSNEHALSSILHSWKSYTSRVVNRILGRMANSGRKNITITSSETMKISFASSTTRFKIRSRHSYALTGNNGDGLDAVKKLRSS